MPVLRITFILCLFLMFAVPSHAQTVRDLYEQAVDAYNQEQFDKAIELYQQITKIAPHFAPAYVGIGLSLKSKGADIDEVLYYYKTATNMDPTNAQAFEQRGRLYYGLNKFSKAEKDFLQVLKIDPGIVSARQSLAWIYLMGKSRPELAIKYFKEVLKRDPSPNTYFGLGMAYFANNNRIEALDMITNLRKMKQDDFANRLEQMVRDNRKVVTQPDADDEPLVSTPTSPAAPAANNSNTNQPSTEKPTGVKVRLSGKLSDLE